MTPLAVKKEKLGKLLQSFSISYTINLMIACHLYFKAISRSGVGRTLEKKSGVRDGAELDPVPFVVSYK